MRFVFTVFPAIICGGLSVMLCSCFGNDTIPIDLGIENASATDIWFSWIEIDNKSTTFGLVSKGKQKASAYSLRDLVQAKSFILRFRVSSTGEAGTAPWIERAYSANLDPQLFPGTEVGKDISVRVVYAQDGTVRLRVYGPGRPAAILGEKEMQLTETGSTNH
jgi:hypothetical protein